MRFFLFFSVGTIIACTFMEKITGVFVIYMNRNIGVKNDFKRDIK